MSPKEKNESARLQKGSLRTAQIGFLFLAIYFLTTLIFGAWQLLTPDMLQKRWIITLVALSINTTLWYFSRKPRLVPLYYRGIIFLQMCMYLAIATFSIYTERGMASNAVILYAIPLTIAALSYSAQALFASATICAISYASATILYFKQFPSEGYKVELYGSIVFYIGILYLLSTLLWIIVRARNART